GAAPASAPRRPAPGRQLGEGAEECRSAPPAPAPAPFVVLVVLVGAQEFVRQGRKVVQRGLLGPVRALAPPAAAGGGLGVDLGQLAGAAVRAVGGGRRALVAEV